MRIKLDENLGQRGAALLRAANHDLSTVYEEGLTSAADEELIEVCRREQRCLVTLDLDFSNPFLFDPQHSAGIVVLRPSAHPSDAEIQLALQTLATGLEHSEVDKKLWIIQRARIREYTPE